MRDSAPNVLVKEGTDDNQECEGSFPAGLWFSQGEWICDHLILSNLAQCSMYLGMKGEDWLPGSRSEKLCDSEHFLQSIFDRVTLGYLRGPLSC